jgi:hypothetical protein
LCQDGSVRKELVERWITGILGREPALGSVIWPRVICLPQTERSGLVPVITEESRWISSWREARRYIRRAELTMPLTRGTMVSDMVAEGQVTSTTYLRQDGSSRAGVGVDFGAK